jgi:ubiquinone/menaquinone biosynthesis C-methylase UbiE
VAALPPLSAGKRMYVEQVAALMGEGSPRSRAVLEAGVGMGVTAVAVAQRLSARHRFSAIDLDPVNIAALEARLTASPTCEVSRLVVGDVRAMDTFEDGSFDVVCGDTVVAMLGVDLHRPFAEILRVLRPGGSVVLRELLPPRLDETTRRDVFLRVVCAARMLVGDGYAMLPPVLVASVLKDVGFVQSTYRTIRETGDEAEITHWYPLSDPTAPLRDAFVGHYRRLSAACTTSGGCVADSYLLVAHRPPSSR